MGDTLNDMKVRLGADIGQFREAMSQANGYLDSVADAAKLAGKGLAALAVVGGLGRVAQEITEIALAAGHQAEELSQLAQITGRNTSSLQDWDVMLNRVGLSQHDLSMGLKTLAQKVEEARAGAGAASDRFRQMGIDLTKLHSTEEILRAIAERSSTMAGGLEKSAAMSDLLGRMGARLIPAFDGGAKAIDEAAKKSAEMTKLSGGQIAVLGQMDDAVDDLRKGWERFGQQLGAVVAPTITAVAEALTWLVGVGARVFKEMDTAADTLAIRFSHIALAINEAASVLFSTEMFSPGAWKQALSNIDLIDKEAAKLIAKRRELANTPEANDARASVPKLQNSEALNAARQAQLDAMQRMEEQAASAWLAIWKAKTDNTLSLLEQQKQAFLKNDVDIADGHAKAAEAMSSVTAKALVNQISIYNEYVQKRLATFGTDEKSLKDKVAFEGQASQKIVQLWGKVVEQQIQGDTKQIQSAVAVAAAKQAMATKEAEAGYAHFQLYQAMTEREKQLDLDRANSHLALVQAQEGQLAGAFQDHRRILDATLAAVEAEEAKELASATITEAQKAVIRERFAAQRLTAETTYTKSVQAQQQSQLADAAKVADAQFNLAKAEYDSQFTLFRDTEGLRQAKLNALTAQYQADIAQAQLTADQKLAIETNYQAQVRSLAQQFPSFWQQQMQLIQQSATFTWSSITTSFASSVAGVIQGTTTMAQFFSQALNTMLTAAINMLLQLMANWVATTVFKTAQDGKQVAAFTAMEQAKTAAATAGETARTLLVVAGNKAMLAGTTATIVAMGAVGNAALAVLAVALQAVVGFMGAIAAAVAWVPYVGQALAGAIIVGATMAETAGTTAIAAGLAAINMAIGTATVASTTALATPFAEGGIVTGPTFALIGEAGPEAVLPLSQMNALSGGETHLHIYGMTGNEVGRYVVDNFGKSVRLQTGVAFG